MVHACTCNAIRTVFTAYCRYSTEIMVRIYVNTYTRGTVHHLSVHLRRQSKIILLECKFNLL